MGPNPELTPNQTVRQTGVGVLMTRTDIRTNQDKSVWIYSSLDFVFIEKTLDDTNFELSLNACITCAIHYDPIYYDPKI